MSTSTAPVEATSEKKTTERTTKTTPAPPSNANERVRRTAEPKASQETSPEDRVEREKDGPDGNPIGGLVEGLKSWAEPHIEAVEKRAEKIETQHDRKWDDPRDALRNLKQNGDLTTYSGGQLNKLNVLSQVSPEAHKAIQGRVARTVNRADSLDDLPRSRAFQTMVQRDVAQHKPDILRTLTQGPTKLDQAQQKLDTLADQAVKESLDRQLEGREGDSEAESAMQDWNQDLKTMARQDPALYPMLREAAQGEARSGETEDRLEDIAEADDTFWDDARGTLGDVAGTVTDNIPFIGSAVPGGALLKHVPVVGDGVKAIDGAREDLLKNGGSWLGDRASDLMRWDPSPLKADGALGNAIELFGGDGQKFEHQMRGGLGNFADSTVTGLSASLADPGGTAKGAVDLAMRVPNPVRSLIEGSSLSEQAEHDGSFWKTLGRAATREYARTSEEYGTVGAVTQILAEGALTLGTGGAEGALLKGLKASRLANAANTYDEMTHLSTVLPKIDKVPQKAVDWADSYQNLNDLVRRSAGKVRGEVSGSAETADEKEERQEETVAHAHGLTGQRP